MNGFLDGEVDENHQDCMQMHGLIFNSLLDEWFLLIWQVYSIVFFFAVMPRSVGIWNEEKSSRRRYHDFRLPVETKAAARHE